MIHESKNDFGGNFEDFVIGDIFKHWPGKTITEMDNHLFSLLTMNHNPLHIDEAFAKDNGFKGNVVYGMLVSSLYSRLVGMNLP